MDEPWKPHAKGPYMIPFIWNPQGKSVDTENRLVVTLGWEDGGIVG